MHLSKLLVINYRSCQNVLVELKSNEPNVLIGINDSGKSSILKAAELLFSDKPHFSFVKDNSAKNDLSNTPLSNENFETAMQSEGLPVLPYDGRQCYILGKLIVSDGELTEELLQSLSVTARWTLESYNSQFIWIAKCFDTAVNSVKHYVLLNDTERDRERISAFGLTNAQINRLVSELAIPPGLLQNENNAGPLSILEKVRAVYHVQPPEPVWHAFKFEKSDKVLLPAFRYLDWNCSLEEIKALAADAMSGLVEEYLTPLRTQARNSATDVTDAINERLQAIQAIIGADFPSITAIKTKVYIDLKESITDIIINKANADGDIHLDAQGEGVKRQIWFAMIKAASVTALEEGHNYNKFIWAFDEPETHLYPTAQRQLFELIRNISSGNVQTILSTHSTIFIDKTKLNSITGVIQNEGGYTEQYGIDQVHEIFENLEVRNSDFLFFNKFLVIEGDTEAYLIPRLYKLWKGHSHVEDNIQIINIKGKEKWLEAKQILENIFRDFRKDSRNLVFLFDNDASYQLGQNAIRGNMFFVGTQDLEDSIASDVWVNICNEKLEEWKLTIELNEIEQIKSSIPSDRPANHHEKFYPKLQRILKQKVSEKVNSPISYNLLSDKGIDSGEMLLQFLEAPEDIPAQIKAAFIKLSDN